MKRLYLCLVSTLLAIPLILILWGFALPAQYDDTFLGELQVKRALLAAPSDKPRIIIVGGSAAAFGVDSTLIEQELPDYAVVNYGLYAALGTRVMLDLSVDELRTGDIVIVMPEQQRQTLSDYLGADAMWQAADGNYDALLSLHMRDAGEMLAAYPAFAAQKFRYWLQGKPAIDGVYQRDSFDTHGDVVSTLCTANIMPNGYDSTTMVDLDLSLPEEDFVTALNDYTAAAERQGAQVWYHFPPMNEAAVVTHEDGNTGDDTGTTAGNPVATEGEDADTAVASDDSLRRLVDTYAQALQERIDAPLAGDPKDCVMESGWFYDTNFHLNASGKTVYTRQLIRDIKAMLRDSSPTNIALPNMPGPEYIAEIVQDSTDAAYFLYEENDGGLTITGLTEDGLARQELTVPGEIDGQPVTAIDASALTGATNLMRIHIQQNITALPDSLFSDCHSLREIVLLQDEPARLAVGQALLDGVPDTCRILVPAGAYTDYCLSYSWAVYADRIAENGV